MPWFRAIFQYGLTKVSDLICGFGASILSLHRYSITSAPQRIVLVAINESQQQAAQRFSHLRLQVSLGHPSHDTPWSLLRSRCLGIAVCARARWSRRCIRYRPCLCYVRNKTRELVRDKCVLRQALSTMAVCGEGQKTPVREKYESKYELIKTRFNKCRQWLLTCLSTPSIASSFCRPLTAHELSGKT